MILEENMQQLEDIQDLRLFRLKYNKKKVKLYQMRSSLSLISMALYPLINETLLDTNLLEIIWHQT